MKYTTIIFLVLLACKTPGENAETNCYSEAVMSFYDPYDKDFTMDTWIRRPENIRTVHETLKKYGYGKIISDDDLHANPCMIWGYVNKSCADIIDSLILTYPKATTSPKYYMEFWNRRKLEKNDTTVFAILKELKQELIGKSDVPHRDRRTNDTILHLVRIRYEDPKSTEEALENFQYLAAIGLNQSAYNLLFERYSYDEMQWDRESLKAQLRRDSTGCAGDPVIEDDTK